MALTGDRQSAEWVVARALGACDNPLKMRAERRDRLVTQRAREAGRRGPAPTESHGDLNLSAEAAQLWSASRALPRLQLEAWTLRVIEGLDEIPAARALDCSRSAMGAALDEAERSLHGLLGDRYVGAVESIRTALHQADPQESARAIFDQTRSARSRRRLLSLAQFLLFALCAGVLIWVGWDLIKSDEREDPLRGLREQFSAPMPPQAPAAAPEKRP